MHLLIGIALSFGKRTAKIVMMQMRCEPGTYMETW